jgi:CubicO group peptidase (beta-lactamase class C family)
MKYNRPLVCILITMAVFGQAGCESNEGVKIQKHASASYEPASETESLQAKIKDYLNFKHINGTISIVKDNKTIFNEGTGYADFQNGLLNRNVTHHPVGSITKSIVATSIMQLQDKGLLSIQDPVSKYIADFPNGDRIRVVHLLNHTSGIRVPLQRFKARTPAGLISEMKKYPVTFSAGSRWDYRDENYVILGFILEKVTGTTLHKYIEKNIFAKAGMKHSGFIKNNLVDEAASTGYLKNKFQMISAKKVPRAALFGYADIYSTAHDICLYDTALMGGKLVSRQSLKEMLKPGSSSNYGLGLYNFGYAVYSRGVIGGWEALHVYYRDHTSIALLLNIRDKNQDIHQISKDLFNILDADIPNPRFHKTGIQELNPKVGLL